jgi:hypothetical protein
LHKAQVFSDRMSCHNATANQVRLVLHTAAFWLMHGVRASIPQTSSLAKAEFATIRERLGGCDYQFASQWVLGFEGAWSGADIRGTGPLPDVVEPGTVRNQDSDSDRAAWFCSGWLTGSGEC